MITTASSVLGFMCAILMAITVVGVCRFGDRYRSFFEDLRTRNPLPAIKIMALVYLRMLNTFLGPEVGLKQPGTSAKSKYFGPYIEHLLLLYWIGATILVLSFRPLDTFGEGTNSLLQTAAFITLLTVNVISDAMSLLWTKRCIVLLAIPGEPLTVKKLLIILAENILVAALLMFIVQLMSNGLYAIQIGKPGEFFQYMLDIQTAFKPYAPIDPRFASLHIPGQLLITCTTYLPLLLFYFSCIVIIALMPFYVFLLWILDLLRLDPEKQSCNQLGFISALLALGGVAWMCFTRIIPVS